MEKHVLMEWKNTSWCSFLPPTLLSVCEAEINLQTAQPELGKLGWEEPSPPDLRIILRREPWQDAGLGFAQPWGIKRGSTGWDEAALGNADYQLSC